MRKEERERYWMELEEAMLVGGVAYSEWCNFIAKDTYTAFVHGADLSTVVMSLACVETYLKTETPDMQNQPLHSVIDNESMLCDDEKEALHSLRRYRNKWVHLYNLDDDEILKNEEPFISEAERMACLAVKMLLTILFSNQFV
ncbi:MAG: hypothetical protein FWH57_10170 [Oscillospiraceae bacterium]|nr:hypothetical protein [Oscillospiraceae bacterium]